MGMVECVGHANLFCLPCREEDIWFLRVELQSVWLLPIEPLWRFALCCGVFQKLDENVAARKKKRKKKNTRVDLFTRELIVFVFHYFLFMYK